jgi:arylsulfatase A-like enzyme
MSSDRFNFEIKRFTTLPLAGLLIYLYVLMEWVFFVTKPSFMSSMTLFQTASILFISGFIFLIPTLALVAFLSVVVPSQKTWVAALVPALVLTCLALILFDNFTYTVFHFGIVHSEGPWRGVYAAGVLILFFIFLRKISTSQQGADRPAWHRDLFLVLLFICGLTFIFQIPQLNLNERDELASARSSTLPNIILLGLDGVNATHMSVYGYARKTTPNLEILSGEALFVENAFSNAGKTGGSLTSLLTGKPSTETRVIFPPDILMGEDAYEHLPGILQELGYSTIQISMPYYGDAYERNIRDGFDIVNFRSPVQDPLLARLAEMGGGGGPYFAGQILIRITERLAHIFFIKSMQDPFAIVTQHAEWIRDDERLAAAYRYLNEADRPLFLHVHLMDMHGPEFYVPHQVFSAGQVQADKWDMDFYDDAMLGADRSVAELFDYLSTAGKLENTVVILYSDHGMEWDPLDRVPLIFWFPGNEYQGTISQNVQLLDIAPTILDYLDVAQPVWMKGRSILTNDLPAARPVFSATVGDETVLSEDMAYWMVDESRVSAPFYQLGRLNLIMCNLWFSLNLREPELTYGTVEGSTANCAPEEMPAPEAALDLLVQSLIEDDYDMSDFPDDVPIRQVP